MADRPYTLLSCAVSLDGYLDRFRPAAGGRPLQLSSPADFDRVDAVRAASDAILVGAVTLRNDNPRLLVRSAERRRARENRGLSPSPAKVTLTRTAPARTRARLLRDRCGRYSSSTAPSAAVAGHQPTGRRGGDRRRPRSGRGPAPARGRPVPHAGSGC